MPKPQTAVIDAILQDRFPLKNLLGIGYAITGKAAGESLSPDLDRQRDEIETARLQLTTLPPVQLKALHDAVLARQKARADALDVKKLADLQAKDVAKEAARFYNQADAHADFEHWCKADNWTFDEAVALLLAKDPGMVNPQAFERELSADLGLFFIKKNKAAAPTGFARTYQRLRTLIERADALAGPRLKPWAVIEWARRTKAVDLPEPLACMAPPAGPSPSNEAAPPEVGAALPQPKESPAVQPARQDGITPKKWTDELKAELAAYRQVHGTKAAAAYFRIAESRVRALLPKQAPAPAGYSAFNTHRMK